MPFSLAVIVFALLGSRWKKLSEKRILASPALNQVHSEGVSVDFILITASLPALVTVNFKDGRS